MRGKWVELDREKLREVLAYSDRARRAAADGPSFREATRLRSRAALADGEAAAAPERAGVWSRVVAGGWLEETLDGLRRPEGLAAASPGAALKTTLRPYQEVGVRWLWFLNRLGLGVCVADDMGLGKTMPLYWTKVS